VKDKVSWADEDDDVDPVKSAMQAASSIFTSPNVTYVFRLSRTGTFSATNGAQFFGHVSWDVSNCTEFTSYLQNLFNEVRIRRARIKLVRVGGGITQTAAAFIASSDQGFTATDPATIAAVQDNPDSRLLTCGQGDAINIDGENVIDVHVPNDYLFSSCITPALEPNQGTYGQFQIAQMAVSNATSPAFVWQFEGWYEFRSRT